MIKDFLKDVFEDLSLIQIVLIVILIGGVGTIGTILFMAVDSIDVVSVQTAQVVVTKKDVIPGHYTSTTVVSGKFNTSTRITTYHAEETRISFFILEGEELTSVVDRKLFDLLKVGDQVSVEYGYGRLTGSIKTGKIILASK